MKKRSEHTGSETRQENDDSTVGYRRPPVHTRFKPGESGNPKGRPKRAKNYRTVLNSILKEKVTVREGGKVRIMPKYEAILHALVMNAIQGKARARAILLELAREQGQFDPSPPINEIKIMFVKPDGTIAPFEPPPELSSSPQSTGTNNNSDVEIDDPLMKMIEKKMIENMQRKKP
jgi:hypothetical protein